MNQKKQHSDFETFKAYYSGNMKPEERIAFEENLANDPFAQEAYDGFLNLETDAKRLEFMENSSTAFQHRHNLNRDIVVFPVKSLVGVAASLALLIGVFYIVQKQFFGDETLAENNIPETEVEDFAEIETTDIVESETIIISDSFPEYIEDEDFSAPEELETQQVIPPAPKEIKTVKKEKALEEKPKPKTNSKPSSTKDGYASQNQKTVKDQSQAKVDSQTEQIDKTATYNSISVPTEATEEKSSKGLINDYQSGIMSYNQSKFDEAIKFFNNSVNQKTNINNSYYYIGMSYFNLGKSNKAITYFDKVIGTDSSFSDDSQYYKALTLIGKGQKENAKTILQQLVKSNSSFKIAAQNKLETL